MIFINWHKGQNNIITELINKFGTARNGSKDRVKVYFAHHSIPSAYHSAWPIAGAQ